MAASADANSTRTLSTKAKEAEFVGDREMVFILNRRIVDIMLALSKNARLPKVGNRNLLAWILSIFTPH